MKKLIPLLSVIVLLCFSSLAVAVADKEADDSEGGGTGYLPLEPAFVVNIFDGGRTRFLQVQIQLKLSNMAQSETILHHESVIRHAMLMLLSGQKTMELYSSVGKERLRVKALKAVRAALKDKIKKISVDNLYFTNFIIQ